MSSPDEAIRAFRDAQRKRALAEGELARWLDVTGRVGRLGKRRDASPLDRARAALDAAKEHEADAARALLAAVSPVA